MKFIKNVIIGALIGYALGVIAFIIFVYFILKTILFYISGGMLNI